MYMYCTCIEHHSIGRKKYTNAYTPSERLLAVNSALPRTSSLGTRLTHVCSACMCMKVYFCMCIKVEYFSQQRLIKKSSIH